MSLFLILSLQAASDPEILVIASRTPVSAESARVSATVINERRIEALGQAQAVDLLRLAPGVSVSTSGARGAQSQLRIRGGEANHSLLFIDGIRFNDIAAGNEARFETLSADGLGRIEIVRGPQSALWGSEALGGVIALESPDPLRGTRVDLLGEYGGRESRRGAMAGTIGDERHGATLTVSHAESEGIDILGGGTGDLDGFENNTIGFRSVLRPGANAELGLAARYIDADNAFDGTDPLTFLRADTLDNSESETAAVRAWGTIGIDPASPWSVTIEGQYLTSENRNFNDATPLNQSDGDRFIVGGQVERRMVVAGGRHALIAAVEREGEDFSTRDQQFFGATDQARDRARMAFVGEWRAEWTPGIRTGIAVRHDDFNRFADETTLRANASVEVTDGLSLFGSYGEGIAQPTFLDLYGFFPGSFVGNPDLTPERARGYEAGIAWNGETISLSATAFRSVLRDEIVSVFDSTTFLSSTANATGKSRRQGIEFVGAFRPVEGLRIDANYTFIDADDQQVADGAQLRETRRARHSANLVFDWEIGPLLIGGSVAYVGKRQDSDFDLFPAATVKLEDYFLASARVAWRVAETVEIYARVDNLFDERYQDVVGYATPGRTAYAGIRLRLGD